MLHLLAVIYSHMRVYYKHVYTSINEYITTLAMKKNVTHLYAYAHLFTYIPHYSGLYTQFFTHGLSVKFLSKHH